MKRTISLSLLLGLLLAACSHSVGPSSSELKQRLAIDLPHPWEVHSFSIQASENVGTKVEPLVKNRFKAKLVANEDTFIADHRESGVTLIKPAVRKGGERELYGVATSKLTAGSWQTEFDYENNPFSDAGKPRSGFQGRTIIVGSAEEAQFQNAIAQQQREKQAAQARAAREQARAAAEKQAEELQQEKARAAAEARAAQEKREAEARAARKRAEVIAEALASGRTFSGKQFSGSGSPTRFQIHFQSFDRSSGKVRGQNRWFSNRNGELKPPNYVQGTLTGDSLSLAEQVHRTETTRGGAILDKSFMISYQLTLAPSEKQLQGQWSIGRNSGKVTIDLH